MNESLKSSEIRAVNRNRAVGLSAVCLMLLLIFGCDASDPGAVLVLVTETRGDEPDEDGYTLIIDGESRSIASNASLDLSGLSGGLVSLELTDVAPNCTVAGANPRSIDPEVSGDIRFVINCIPRGFIFYLGINPVTGPGGRVGDVYRMRTDGSDVTRITTSEDVRRFDLSSDGTQMVYSRIVAGYESPKYRNVFDLYVMDLVSGSVRALYSSTPAAALTLHSRPVWSPDGSTVSFSAEVGGSVEDVFVMDASGGGILNLTRDDANHHHPSWSPDGSQLVFGGNPSLLGYGVSNFYQWNDLYVINANASGLKNLTIGSEFSEQAIEPAWSPLGNEIAFVRQHSVPGGLIMDLYVTDPNGASFRQLTNTPGFYEEEPRWRPDGIWLTFATEKQGTCGRVISIIRADGTELRDVSGCSGPDPSAKTYVHPVWVLP